MNESRAELQNRKRSLRVECRRKRSGIEPFERYEASRRIAETIGRSSYFHFSRRIACYLPMPEEVDTWPIIERAWRRKKRIFTPITSAGGLLQFRELVPESDLLVNDWGLTEPVKGATITARELDLVLTPLVAFDANRRRIGMGGGYYDRTFAFLGNRQQYFRPKLVGLAFDCQRVEKIYANPWDISLYRVVTERTATG